MSSENNTNSGPAGIIANLKSNPKAMAIAGGIVALVLFLIFKGSSDEGVTAAKVVPVSIGQKVTIQNPNILHKYLVQLNLQHMFYMMDGNFLCINI